jgi:VCBS repeat-containing protein
MSDDLILPNLITGSGPIAGTPLRDVILGSAGVDSIEGGDGDDVLIGLGGDDGIAVGAGDDLAYGGAGDDVILAGAGDNVLDGGRGIDTVVYRSAIEAYSFVVRDGAIRVTRGEDAFEGAGHDLLSGFERFAFADGRVIDLTRDDNAPIAVDDTFATDAQGRLTLTAADVLGNDLDPDGDAVFFAGVEIDAEVIQNLSFRRGVATYEFEGFDALAAGQTVVQTVGYTIRDADGNTDDGLVTITVTGVNDGPVLDAPEAVSVAEGATEVADLDATDIDGDTVAFAIAGGADAALFTIDAETGALAFAEGRDFEAPGDADGDNVYEVVVAATDGQGGRDERALAVTVTDVEGDEPLVINEFVGSTTGPDAEFVELFGAAGASLAGLSLLVIESDAGDDLGRIDARFDLPAGAVIGENGFYLIGNDLVTPSAGGAPDALLPANFIENSSYTLALVETATAGAVGDAAGGETVIDAVGVTDGGEGDAFAYGAPVIGPDGPFLPAGGARVEDGVDTDQASDFALADFQNVANTPTAAGAADGGGGATEVAISEVQGAGDASPLAGQTVTVTAIVSGDFQDGDADAGRNLGGFYLIEEVADRDDDAATSEGVFVFEGDALLTDVALGDRVTVTGTVTEFFGATQISATSVEVVEAGAVADVNALAVDVSLEDDVDGVIDTGGGTFRADLEAYEGMLVNLTDTLTVTETFQLDRFNEVRVSASGRPEQFTQSNAPDADAFEAYQREIRADEIVFDDGLSVQNAPIFAEADLDGDGDFDTADGFGIGDTADGLTGVIDYSFGEYRIRGVEDGANAFADTQTRETEVPEVGGEITVSTFNVLNFFTTIDQGDAGSGPNLLDPRGADSQAEFDRQLEKLITTLTQIDADVFGLVELENEFGTDQNGDGLVAIDVLVEALNDGYGAGTWAAVDPGRGFVDTGDAISVGMIYKTASVSLVPGSVEILDDSDLDDLGFGALDDDGLGVFDGPSTNRAPLLADFQDAGSGEVFSVAVTHMKSKGGSGEGANADQGDGAGNFDALRTEGVEVLTEWLSREADADVLVLGDFNAYAEENPVEAMEAAGYVNLEELYDPGATTFVFDGQTGTLDYAFASAAIQEAVTGAAAWEINAVEPDALDYNLDFGRDPDIFDGSVPFRSSDHDPLLVGLDFSDGVLLA